VGFGTLVYMQSSCKEIQCICEWKKNNKILSIPETMQGISTSADSKEESGT
jgi:hypothetical protein